MLVRCGERRVVVANYVSLYREISLALGRYGTTLCTTLWYNAPHLGQHLAVRGAVRRYDRLLRTTKRELQMKIKENKGVLEKNPNGLFEGHIGIHKR